MKSRLSSIFVVAAMAAGLQFGTIAPAQAADYEIDTAHSFINFRTLHLGYSWLVGRFNRFEGGMTFDSGGEPVDQSIDVTIDTTSLDTNHATRDRHLRGGRYLDVDTHPTARFVSTGFDGDASGGILTGDLTFMGETRSIAFEVTLIGEGGDPWGGYRAGFEGSFVLTPADFGLNYNLGPGAEQVIVEMLIEAVKQ